MNEVNSTLIQRFYQAFTDHDVDTMLSCYHENVRFSDPVFGDLDAEEVRAMWRMLLERGGKDLSITFGEVKADDTYGSARWEAVYPFSKTGRKVHNKIKATFVFKDHKIIDHKDHFSFWKWSAMALGIPGVFLGWSPFLRNKVSAQSLKLLNNYKSKHQKQE